MKVTFTRPANVEVHHFVRKLTRDIFQKYHTSLDIKPPRP